MAFCCYALPPRACMSSTSVGRSQASPGSRRTNSRVCCCSAGRVSCTAAAAGNAAACVKSPRLVSASPAWDGPPRTIPLSAGSVFSARSSRMPPSVSLWLLFSLLLELGAAWPRALLGVSAASFLVSSWPNRNPSVTGARAGSEPRAGSWSRQMQCRFFIAASSHRRNRLSDIGPSASDQSRWPGPFGSPLTPAPCSVFPPAACHCPNLRSPARVADSVFGPLGPNPVACFSPACFLQKPLVSAWPFSRLATALMLGADRAFAVS